MAAAPTTTRPPTATTHPATTTTQPPKVAGITINGFAFTPMVLSVAVGTRVTVTNHDTVAHTWTADKGAFNSGLIQPGASYHFTFTSAGTYRYHCAVHTFMTGTVNVT